jgi:aminoglycoside phosphotransferase (APT) family kinase protein
VIEQRVARAVGMKVHSLRRVQTRGYAMAYHAIAELSDGSTAFVKAGAEEITSNFLREELRFYRSVEAPFMPRLLGYDQGDPPFLVLEDLSGSRWPPPWDEQAIEQVEEALRELWSASVPDWVPPITDEREWLLDGWATVEGDPDAFLSLGLGSREWLDDALPVLRRAAESAPIEGDSLLHLDVRSDNVCLSGRGAVLVDWNLVHVGNADLDLAAWAPSLHHEGGPPPEQLLPNAPGLAAAIAGYFASRAGLPPPPTAPKVREIQRAQLEVALDWSCRALDLEWDR